VDLLYNQGLMPATAPVLVPYGSWHALERFLDHFDERKSLPERIDQSSFPKNMKGPTIEQVRPALRRLRLIDASFRPTTRFMTLWREPMSEDRKSVWKDILYETYHDLFKSKFELRALTAHQVREQFERWGGVPSTRERAMRFMWHAFTYAGIEYDSDLEQSSRHERLNRKSMARSTTLRGIPSVDAERRQKVELGDYALTIGRPPTDDELERLKHQIDLEQDRRKVRTVTSPV
jgi:hypothetical protein